MPTSGAGEWTQPQIDLGLSGEPSVTAGGEQAVFSPAEVRRYTGVTYRQLDHWASRGIFVPGVRTAAGSGTRRLYSFRDILAIRVLKRLSDAGISVRNVSRAVETLRRLGEADLASTVLVSDGATVYECRADHEVIDLLRGGQGVFAVVVSHALADLRQALTEPAPTALLAGRRPRRRGAARAERATDAGAGGAARGR